ncbi:DUF3999 family protein [Sphingomonas sp. HHU CXW]|uniref:DUF3999 family protein n=1 Tax=Sphingomonas hominis TaxID=2741495 RepID=A0ABX2JI78_9SPHN|nr:DUF3999 family protein [Sphingomonas hominis]NTS66335.1 DUF3999 family protein [Sphingomonas hominis]
MIAKRRLMLLAMLLTAAAPAETPDDARAYHVRIAVVPGAGSRLQRVTLPPAALAAVRTSEYADMRVFDARGRAMPMARVASARATRRDLLRALPILGGADALKVSGVSLQLDGDVARVARVDGKIVDDVQPAVLGVLLDARGVTGAARTLTLDADVPQSQPVTFVVEASRDLSTWRKLGEQTVFRAVTDTQPVTIALDAAPLRGDYIRVTWRLASRALSPVTIRSGQLASDTGSIAPTWIAATLPAGARGRTIDLTLPFAAPLATLAITPAVADSLVPVRILGRDDAEQPWTPLGQGIAAHTTRAIPLNGNTFRLLRIEADSRSSGFTATPSLRLGFAPADIVFLTAGTPPYTLAAGRAEDTNRYLPLDSLAADAGNRPPALAQVAAAPARVALAAAADPQRGSRQLLLWAVLLAATALLAALAWRLSRNPSPTPQD